MAHSQVYFGAGCFWGPALRFKRIPGVIDTEVGYCNGDVENVTYEDVCSGTTGHNEVVRVMYDSSEVSLRALLEEFFLNAHDPTTLNRQGNDAGTQYRSGAYVNSREELAIVEAMVEELQPRFGGQIVTEVRVDSRRSQAPILSLAPFTDSRTLTHSRTHSRFALARLPGGPGEAVQRGGGVPPGVLGEGRAVRAEAERGEEVQRSDPLLWMTSD